MNLKTLLLTATIAAASVGADEILKRDSAQFITLRKTDNGDCYIKLSNIQGCSGSSSVVGVYDEDAQACVKKDGTPPEGSNQGQGDLCDGGSIMFYYHEQAKLWSPGDAHFDDGNGNAQGFRGLGFEPGCGLFEHDGEWDRVCNLQW